MFANFSLTQTATLVQDREYRRNYPQSLVFIDSSASDYETLLAGVVEGVEAIAIDPNQDGIRQITEILQQHQAIAAIHIVSHGSPGCLYLGNTQLNLNNISKYAELLQHWQSNLSILLYGCNVAAGDAGAEFIHKLHAITNATISASATKTGNAALGGNWNLEVSFPENQETSLAFSEETLATYQGVFTPTLVGEWDYLSTAKAVTIVGNYAYVVGDQLEIIDISDPANPIFKGSYKIDNAKDVQVVGNYAYVINDFSGLNIIDISNPAAPTLKGNYSITGFVYTLQVVGNYAYVVNDLSKLQIIDISDPTAPILKGNYSNNGFINDVEVVGNYAYVAAGDKGLQIIDISNPTNPTLKGNYTAYGNNSANRLQVVGNYAYVADTSSGLKIINISNPAYPNLVYPLKGNYPTSNNGYPTFYGYPRDVKVVGNYAYLADYSPNGLEIVDISNPAQPIFKGFYYTSSSFIYDVEIVGNYAYLADGTSGLEIIDISNPAAPTFKSNYNTSDFARGVQVVGNYAYVADGTSGLAIIDIIDPTVPTPKGNYNTSGSASGVQIVGNYAYVADGASGLQIIDISNPTAPTFKGNYNTSGYASGVQIVGNYAYVADGASGLQIIDISNPAAPTLKGNYDTSGYASGVQIVGNYAYVADGTSGLEIIDISDPAAPTLKGNYDTSGYASGVQIVGNYAYVADGTSGLQIIDISNPAAPTLKGNYDTSGSASGVQIVGNYAYVADGTSGLEIIDISDPTAPTLKDNYDTSGSASGVQVVGNYAYVADGTGGLKIIMGEFTASSTPNEPPTNLTLSNSTIAENQAINTFIGNFNTTDPDIGNIFIYGLVAGTGATDNDSFIIVGNQIRTNVVFDYETKNSYSVRVRTTDQGGLFYEQPLAISVINVNDAPVVTLTGDTLSYIENDTTIIDSAMIVGDVDSANLVSATVSITNGFTLGQDYLNFTNQNGITGSYNSNTGVLTLTGSATIADYQTALRSITYTNSSDSPSTTLRTITFQVNDGSLDSSVVTRNVKIIPVNDFPVLVNQNFTVNEGSTIIVTNSMLQTTDVDNTDNQLIYTIKELPVNGILQLNGINLAVNGTFSQDDINNSRVTYIHNGSKTTNDSFNFVLSDSRPMITRISTASDGTQANGDSSYPSISADGRYVVFESYASDLVSGDTNGRADVFVKDLTTNVTTRISAASNGTQANDTPTHTAISADGRYVVFESSVSNLVSGDTNYSRDVFFKDLTTNSIITRISTASDGTQANSSSYFPSISADGRYVVFESDASNLVSGDTNNSIDVFVKDLTTNAITRISTASDGTQANKNYPFAPFSARATISADGRYVVFESYASNLVSGDTNNNGDVFVKNLTTNATTRISTASDGTQANSSSYFPSISADGRYVVFVSDASNLVSGDTNGSADVFVKDLTTNATTRISTASDGTQANGSFYSLSISADGRYVVFDSSASNLVSGDTNGRRDVFVKDLTTNTITRISSASDGTQGNSNFYSPSISADGRYVVFESSASNLVSGDTNGRRDVFVYTLGVINGSASITVNPINDAPVIVNNTSTAICYIENATTAIDSTIILSDVDSANLVSATISITNGFTLGQDYLNFTNQNGITGSYNSNIGVLTLTGSATVADYQTALRSITYTNSSDILSNTLRSISFQVNDGSLDSSVVTRNVTIIPQAPITGSGYNPLTGTTGNDVIIGGPGAKTLTGNGGNDVFVFNSLKDVGQSITDFGVGDDKIDISQLLTNIGYSGTDPIADGYVQFVLGSTANSSVLQIDRDGVFGSAIFKNFLQFDNVTPTQMNNSDNFVFNNIPN